MFKNLFNFSHQRNWKEAIGFFVVYFIAALIIGGLTGGIVGIVSYTPEQDPEALKLMGAKGGLLAGMLFSTAVCFLLLKTKKLLASPHVLFLLLTPALALLIGGISLVCPAFLTTRAARTDI